MSRTKKKKEKKILQINRDTKVISVKNQTCYATSQHDTPKDQVTRREAEKIRDMKGVRDKRDGETLDLTAEVWRRLVSSSAVAEGEAAAVLPPPLQESGVVGLALILLLAEYAASFLLIETASHLEDLDLG